jgi:hypothetical protein
MKQSELLDKLIPAFIKMQKEIPVLPRDSENPYFHSGYADIATVCKQTKPIMQKYGFAIMQGCTVPVSTSGQTVIVNTRLVHESGQWIESELLLGIEKPDPQKLTAAITYGRRTSWAMLLGAVQDGEDDDGNKAQGLKVAPGKKISDADPF